MTFAEGPKSAVVNVSTDEDGTIFLLAFIWKLFHYLRPSVKLSNCHWFDVDPFCEPTLLLLEGVLVDWLIRLEIELEVGYEMFSWFVQKTKHPIFNIFYVTLNYCIPQKGPNTRCNVSCNVAPNKIFWGCHTKQFVTRNVANVELDSTSTWNAQRCKKNCIVCLGRTEVPRALLDYKGQLHAVAVHPALVWKVSMCK